MLLGGYGFGPGGKTRRATAAAPPSVFRKIEIRKNILTKIKESVCPARPQTSSRGRGSRLHSRGRTAGPPQGSLMALVLRRLRPRALPPRKAGTSLKGTVFHQRAADWSWRAQGAGLQLWPTHTKAHDQFHAPGGGVSSQQRGPGRTSRRRHKRLSGEPGSRRHGNQMAEHRHGKASPRPLLSPSSSKLIRAQMARGACTAPLL